MYNSLDYTGSVKYDQPRGRKVADYPLKGPQTHLAPEGGRKAMKMMIMTMMMMLMMMIMMRILMMTTVIVICFLNPKGPLTGLAPGPKNHDDDDDNDD